MNPMSCASVRVANRSAPDSAREGWPGPCSTTPCAAPQGDLSLTITAASPLPAPADRAADASLSFRPAQPSDWPHLRELLSLRDGHPWDEADVRRAVFDLDPRRCVTWLALAGDIPVGMSSVLLRELRWAEETYRAGYWAQLFVRPEYRRRMIYPMLPRAMFRELRAEGLDFIYTGVRRPRVAEAHQRIGLQKIAEFPVLTKPLRPVKLIVRHKGLNAALESLGRPVDDLYATYLRLRWWSMLRRTPAEQLGWDTPQLAQVAALWREANTGCIAQPWSAEGLRVRYTTPGQPAEYALSVVRRNGRLAAAAVYRAVPRDQLQAGVLLDLVHADKDIDSAQRVLAAAERAMHRRGCHVMLALAGPGPRLDPILRGAGYLQSSQKYVFLLLPCRPLAPDSPLYDASRWGYGFGDHDAF